WRLMPEPRAAPMAEPCRFASAIAPDTPSRLTPRWLTRFGRLMSSATASPPVHRGEPQQGCAVGGFWFTVAACLVGGLVLVGQRQQLADGHVPELAGLNVEGTDGEVVELSPGETVSTAAVRSGVASSFPRLSRAFENAALNAVTYWLRRPGWSRSARSAPSLRRRKVMSPEIFRPPLASWCSR